MVSSKPEVPPPHPPLRGTFSSRRRLCFTTARRAGAKRGSAAVEWGRLTGFCPMREGQDPWNTPPILRRWGCRGKSTRIFPRPGFFWFVFLPAKKMNIVPLRPRCARPPLPKGEAMPSPSWHVPTKGEGFCGTRRMTIPPSRLRRATSNGVPAEAQRSGFCGERRNCGTPEVRSVAEPEIVAARSDEGRLLACSDEGRRLCFTAASRA